MINKREIGNFGEDAVCKFLEDDGYKVLKRNYCIRGGEVDIIAKGQGMLLFVEVKTRKKGSLVSGFEAVGAAKQKCIIKTAADYCIKNPNELQPRFDVAEVITDNGVIVDINYLSNAFDTSGYDIIF